MGRSGEPVGIANAVLFLLGDRKAQQLYSGRRPGLTTQYRNIGMPSIVAMRGR